MNEASLVAYGQTLNGICGAVGRLQVPLVPSVCHFPNLFPPPIIQLMILAPLDGAREKCLF